MDLQLIRQSTAKAVLCSASALFALVALPSIARAQSQAQALRFDVTEYVVKNNTVLTREDIEAAVYPYLGPKKGVADVEAARAALEKAYQDRGYLSVVVSLPEQKVQGGTVILEVIQAHVAQVKVTGAQYHLPSSILQALPSLQKDAVPSFPQMQDELAQVQRGGQVQLTPVIGAGKKSDEIDVELKVEDELPLHGQVALSNKRSYNTAAGRLDAGLAYDNLFQRGHSLGLNWSYSPYRPSEVNTVVTNYGLPVNQGSKVLLSWVHSNSNTPTEVGGGTVVKGDTVGVHWRETLPTRGRTIDHSLTAGVDVKNNRDSNQDVLGFTTAKPALRYPAFSLRYDLASFPDQNELTTFDATLTFGTAGLGGRMVDCNGVWTNQFACKRNAASPSFQVLKLGGSHKRALFGNWTLNLRTELQLASGALSSQEQFGAGGVDSVRGYYEFEQVGDQGAQARIELITPSLVNSDAYNLQLLGFFDRAVVRTLSALPTDKASVQLGSAGLGLRVGAGEGLKVALDLAHPLFDTFKRDDAGVYVPASGGRANRKYWTLSVVKAF